MGQDVKALMAYDANKKSLGLALALWLFLGVAGAHRFYLGRSYGKWMLGLAAAGALLSSIVTGKLILAAVLVWALADGLSVPGWVRAWNERLARELGEQSRAV